MLAVIETGGKQVPVSPGAEVRVEKLPGEVGSAVEFTRVVAVTKDDGQLLAGKRLASARVTATITSHGRGKKIIVFRFKRRKHYRRRMGHRQGYTQVKINEIVV